MRQIIQDIKNGQTIMEEIPSPMVRSGAILIKTTRSLVSLGTERMLVNFGKASLVSKARQQPDKVKQVFEKIKTDGIIPTFEAVFNKLNQPLPLGYCNVGIVEAVGKGVHSLKIGDRVASNGNHAEYVCVPENLAAKIPNNVSDEEAAFTVIGSIGLEGIRLCNPTLGETIVVIGLGLIGLVTAELLKANGCRVIGYDFDQQKVNLALSKGIIAFNPKQGNDPVKFVQEFTNSVGADGVLITASNKSDDIIHQAAEMCRQRGRIILIGVVGLNIRRDDFYKKELTFQVSCSYGPGRYDESYEQKGQDYPIGFVRWTEKRNFETVLNAISTGQLNVKSLITERVPFESYNQIYENIGQTNSIASILFYPEDSKKNNIVELNKFDRKGEKGVFGIIGAGNFTSSTIIPMMKSAGANMKYIASAGGLTAKIMARKGNIHYATSDYKEILRDPDVDTIVITTRHNLHAPMVIESLKAGKNIFVEKPLAINENELQQIVEEYNAYTVTHKYSPLIMVGFNRRFAPLTKKMKELTGEGAKNIIANMNAGFIPSNSWVHDIEIGGGRIIGEACHFIDLCSYIAGSNVKSVCMSSMGKNPIETTDNVSILLKYENGSNAVINYFSNGSKAYPKERIEVYSQEKTLIVDNWRVLEGYGTSGFSKKKTKLDKGHREQFRLLVESVKSGKPIIPFNEIINTTRASFAAIQSMKEGRWIDVN